MQPFIFSSFHQFVIPDPTLPIIHAPSRTSYLHPPIPSTFVTRVYDSTLMQAPMMFMLGAKDRRVPLQDGLQYIAALKAVQRKDIGGGATDPIADASVPPPEAAGRLRVLTFPEDSHALDKPQTEFEQWISVAWWLRSHGVV